MLQAPTSESKNASTQTQLQHTPAPVQERHPWVASVYGPTLMRSSSPSAAGKQNVQASYGNQAVLRALNNPQQAARITPLRPSQGVMLQRKCACGGSSESEGECAECKAKREETLWRSAANSATSVIQTKLAINEPGDTYEQEADRIADQVSATPAHPTASATPLKIQRYTGQAARAANAAPASVDRALASSGEPLEPTLRQTMEQRFGYDFSRVRVHSGTDAEQSARDVNAHAYTVGHNIVFGKGRFARGTQEGQRLIAHELTHVVQQNRADATYAPRTIQRAPDNEPVPANESAPPTESIPATEPISAIGPTAATSPTLATGAAPTSKEEGDKAEGTAAVGGRVKRIVIGIEDSVLKIETASTDYLYALDQLEIAPGSYTASVSIKGRTVVFDFGKDYVHFHFRYHINKGQENPATLLQDQKTVGVDVVARNEIDPQAKSVQCLLPLDDRELIKKFASSTPLFKPIRKKTSWHIGEVPLGFLGWIDIELSAGLSLAGLLSYGYGPGVLSDICLYRVAGAGRLGGTARFKFGAAISPSINAKGKLDATAKYVSLLKLVVAGGELNAKAVGRMSGAGDIDRRVFLSYEPLRNKWYFDAEALISGRANLRLTADLSARVEVLYKTLWSKQWPLVDRDFQIGWMGGLRIGTNTTPRFDFGRVGILSEADTNAPSAAPNLPTATAPDPLATEATIDDKAILTAAFNKNTGAPATGPQGMKPDDALPIIWYKPLNIYLKEIAIPRAIRPEKLDRDDGPTLVEYVVGEGARQRTIQVFIGVGVDEEGESNWPVGTDDHPGKRFQFIEKTEGDEVKDKLRDDFKDYLLPEGDTLASYGYDVDHVHEKQFGGKDALPNLWPAKLGPNRSAGEKHKEQLKNYRDTLGNIAGRWFEIVEVQNP